MKFTAFFYSFPAAVKLFMTYLILFLATDATKPTFVIWAPVIAIALIFFSWKIGNRTSTGTNNEKRGDMDAGQDDPDNKPQT